MPTPSDAGPVPGPPSAPCVVRPWRPADVAEIAAIEAASFARPWTEAMIREELGAPSGRCVVAARAADPAGGEPDPDLLGFALFQVVVDEVQLLIVAVAPAARRRGVATALLAAVEARGAAEGAATVLLEVRASNRAARAFYAAHGYAEVGARPRYYAGREDAVLMARELPEERP